MSVARVRPLGAGPDPLQFSAAVWLTKREAFDACQALADADRFLLRAGAYEVAGALGDLFELFEERLTPVRSHPGSSSSD
jgi:hypothetical protein